MEKMLEARDKELEKVKKEKDEIIVSLPAEVERQTIVETHLMERFAKWMKEQDDTSLKEKAKQLEEKLVKSGQEKKSLLSKIN